MFYRLLNMTLLALLAASAAGNEKAPAAQLYMDVHELDSVTMADVATAHEQDLAVQEKHGVRSINYWVDPDSGDIFCLSEAASAAAVLDTHREAHGLVSDEIMEVQQGE